MVPSILHHGSSIGNFTVGIPPLRIPEVFLWNREGSGPWDGTVFIGSPQMTPTYDSRVNTEPNTDREAYWSYTNLNVASLRHYKYSYLGDFQMFNINEKGEWEVTNMMQESGCNVYGTCGPNGMCDSKGSPICSCLQGFEPRDREQWTKGNWSSGCQRKSRLQCQRNDSAGQQGEVDGFLRFKNVKVPDQSIVTLASEQECENECLKKCSCSAYIFVVGIGCLHWEDDNIGYMAPEYAMRGKISEKSDVYSFRVLLLEILSGKRNSSCKKWKSLDSDLSLIGHAWRLWHKNETIFVNPSIISEHNEMEISRYVHVGLLCVQEHAKDRPNMSAVLSMLNSEIAELPNPKLPAYTTRMPCSESSRRRLQSSNDLSVTILFGR